MYSIRDAWLVRDLFDDSALANQEKERDRPSQLSNAIQKQNLNCLELSIEMPSATPILIQTTQGKSSGFVLSCSSIDLLHMNTQWKALDMLYTKLTLPESANLKISEISQIKFRDVDFFFKKYVILQSPVPLLLVMLRKMPVIKQPAQAVFSSSNMWSMCQILAMTASFMFIEGRWRLHVPASCAPQAAL